MLKHVGVRQIKCKKYSAFCWWFYLWRENISLGIKRPGCEADHSAPSSARRELCYTSTLPTSLHCMYRDNFPLLFFLSSIILTIINHMWQGGCPLYHLTCIKQLLASVYWFIVPVLWLWRKYYQFADNFQMSHPILLHNINQFFQPNITFIVIVIIIIIWLLPYINNNIINIWLQPYNNNKKKKSCVWLKQWINLQTDDIRSKYWHMPIGAYFVQQDGEDGKNRIMRRFVIVLPHWITTGCSKWRGWLMQVTKHSREIQLQSKNLEGWDTLGDLCVDGRLQRSWGYNFNSCSVGQGPVPGSCT
jgi:hypothetical protein